MQMPGLEPTGKPIEFTPAVPDLNDVVPSSSAAPRDVAKEVPLAATVNAESVPLPHAGTQSALNLSETVKEPKKEGLWSKWFGHKGKQEVPVEKTPKNEQPLVLAGERLDAPVTSLPSNGSGNAETLQAVSDAADAANQPAVINSTNRYNPENQIADFEDKNKAA